MTNKTVQLIPTNWNEREKLREKGQFWTPPWVADAMISYLLDDTKLIFDPAVGKGAFLDALRRVTKKKIPFYGTDIDEDVLYDDIFLDNNCSVEKKDFIKNPPKKLFKSIIANPPYIRHHRIDSKTKLFLKKLTANITGFTLDGRAGYHIFFLLQALNHLEENGKLAFIMPADTCEGTFAKKLWDWISKKYAIECVITFERKATPFPAVDTNPLIFLIKKTNPLQNLIWVKVNEPFSADLTRLVKSNFQEKYFETISVTNRKIQEALDTGFSRPQQNGNGFKYHLSDFAKVMRGIATGSNEFFFLTENQVKELNIPEIYFKIAIGRTKDITGDILKINDVKKLDSKQRPTRLLSIENQKENLPKPVVQYLKLGEEMGLPNRALIQQRKPWFRMEKREIPQILFTYLGRRNSRFILNQAEVLPLTGFLCVYPFHSDETFTHNLWMALNHPDTIKNLSLVGKSYGSGAIKVEPRNLERLGIPEELVEKYQLVRPIYKQTTQLNLFVNEKRHKLKAKKANMI